MASLQRRVHKDLLKKNESCVLSGKGLVVSLGVQSLQIILHLVQMKRILSFLVWHYSYMKHYEQVF